MPVELCCEQVVDSGPRTDVYSVVGNACNKKDYFSRSLSFFYFCKKRHAEIAAVRLRRGLCGAHHSELQPACNLGLARSASHMPSEGGRPYFTGARND